MVLNFRPVLRSKRLYLTAFGNHLTRSFYNLKPPWSVLFFGSDEFSLVSLKVLHNEFTRGKLIHKLDVVTSAKNHPNVVREYATGKHLHVTKWMQESIHETYDVGLVVSFGHLIPASVINIFPLGMVNVHASLLPRWRGAAPIIHAIAEGDTRMGITIMRIKPEKFDIGEIIDQKEIDVDQDVTMPILYNKLAEIGAEALVETLTLLPDKLQRAKPQPEHGITLAPRITSSFAHVNWEHMSARRIYNLGRALTSVYPLFTTWNMEPVKLFDVGLCEEVNNITVLGMPGFVVYDRLDLLIKVRCADGQWVSVKNVAMHNKRPISARDFNNGYIKKQKMEHRVFR